MSRPVLGLNVRLGLVSCDTEETLSWSSLWSGSSLHQMVLAGYQTVWVVWTLLLGLRQFPKKIELCWILEIDWHGFVCIDWPVFGV